MRRLRLCLAALLVSWTAASGLLSGTEALRVEAIDKSVDRINGVLSVRLLNNHDKTVTAWVVSVVRVDDAGKGDTTLYGQDAFRGLDHPDPREIPGLGGPIAPGDSILMEWPIGQGAQTEEQLSVRVLAVLFEDGSYAGNADQAQVMLSERRAEVEEIGALLARLADVAGDRAVVPTLRHEAERLRQEGQAVAVGSGPKAQAPGSVRATVSGIRTSLAAEVEDTALRIEQDRGSSIDWLRVLVESLEAEYASGIRQLPTPTASEE